MDFAALIRPIPYLCLENKNSYAYDQYLPEICADCRIDHRWRRPGFCFWILVCHSPSLAALTLIVRYILLGTVQSAAQFMQATDLEATEKRLNLTLSPKLLYVTNRAYYYLNKSFGSHGPKAD